MITAAGALFAQGCSDLGTSNVPDFPPAINTVLPATAIVGDTITISGSNFGPLQGGSTLFLNECVTGVIITWSDGQIRAKVPNIASTISVRIVVGGRSSNSVGVSVSNHSAGMVSYACDIRPILNFGCAISGCHTGSSPSSGFNQSTYAGLRAGGVHYGSNVIIAGDSTNSEIIKAMRGTATVGRMPIGGPWQSTGVPDSLIRRTALWIQQGAAFN
ncbi:MAG: IPT/TIG domain-containing protein [Ignavibacteriales bacterium]|nr:IPT/TIG domain-containing protein [Ignavibacteriales bacterium]